MDKIVFEEENKKLKDTLEKVKSAYEFLSNSLTAIGKDNLDTLKDLRDNPETSGADFHFFLEQLNQENEAFNLRDKLSRLDEFAGMVKQPYFARIDLEENNELENLYIGKFGFTLDKPIITDWRAKIASIYYRYRYPQKNVSYESQGDTYTSDLKLKRTYDIDNAALVRYYNNDILLDESEIIFDKLSKRTGGVLEDIVETIQESQLNIIESDPRKICIVQGCVGSGKSTVAIHKLSHIFFNYPNLIKPERSIIIAKNQILIGYLSTLFPKLGIFDVRYQTLRELMVHIIFREKIKINYDFSNQILDKNITADSIEELQFDLDKIHEYTKAKIEKLFNNKDYESFGGYKYSKINTPVENIMEIIGELEEEAKMQRDSYEQDPKSLNAFFYKENIKILRRIIRNLTLIKDELENKTFKGLLKKYSINTNTKLNYNDTLLYLNLYLDFFGLKNFKKYEYCVVDEGQDFCALEYFLMGKLILRGRFCILGDLNQAVNDVAIQNWDDIKKVVVEAKNSQDFVLDTNYRSTKPIIDYANSLLSKFTDTYLPKSINRNGPDPIINKYNIIDDLIQNLTDATYNDYKNLDKSIGIICMDDEYYNLVQNILKNKKFDQKKIIGLDENTKINYIPKGIYYMHFKDCKGLEFSKVYVLANDFEKLDSFLQAKKAFIAVTRAMNELIVYNKINV